MKKLATLTMCLLLIGCGEYKYSEVLTEEAMVEDVILAPAQHGSGSGLAMGGNGKMGLVFTDVKIPAKYAVVFRCQHGKFVVEGSQSKHKELWSKLQKGQWVTVRYRELYWIEGDSRTLVKLDFLDASPLHSQ